MEQHVYHRRTLLQATLSTTLDSALLSLGTPLEQMIATWGRRGLTPPQAAPVNTMNHQGERPQPTLALSLTMLQAEATKVQQMRQPLRDELMHLGGLNRIQGFTTEADGELLLLGNRDAAFAPLHIDDLSLALRNAYMTSPAYQGAIGCTIDPSPGKDPWQVQTVQVFGMSPTAMAQRHVSLDYELKRVVTGIVPLGDNVTSLYDMHRLADPLCRDTSLQGQSIATTHRFWFFPKYPEPPPRFLVESGTVLVLKPIDVQLLTEQQFLTTTGQRTGAAPPAPQAERFAQLITTFLATHPPHPWAHLVSDFRIIEVGKLLHFQRVPAASLHYLLHEYALTLVTVPRFVGGIQRNEQGEVVCGSQISERPGPKGTLVQAQSQVQRYRHTARGGVEVKITLPPEHFVEERGGTLEPLRRQVRSARPTPRALLWPLAV